MSDVSQIVANSLLSNINRTNSRNTSNSSYGDSNAASFDRMLQSSLNNLMGGSTNSSCSCGGGGNNDLSQLLMLTTMISVLNSVKVDASQGNTNNVGNTTDNTNSGVINNPNNRAKVLEILSINISPFNLKLYHLLKMNILPLIHLKVF